MTAEKLNIVTTQKLDGEAADSIGGAPNGRGPTWYGSPAFPEDSGG
ncbi:MAG: hypothetical protein WBP56_07320 [Polyangia bacterium]|jgi:hypothetical protein